MQKELFSFGSLPHAKILIIFSILCTLTFITACKSPESPEKTADTYYLSGTVTDNITGLSIDGASVRLLNPGIAKQTTTNKDGYYSITYTGPGYYVFGTAPKPCMLEVLFLADYLIEYATLPSTAGTYTIDFQLKPRSD